jgi:hypothetical protein
MEVMGQQVLSTLVAPLWRGSLLPSDCKAVAKTDAAVCLKELDSCFWGCCAAQREQAPSPQGVGDACKTDYKSATQDFS